MEDLNTEMGTFPSPPLEPAHSDPMDYSMGDSVYSSLNPDQSDQGESDSEVCRANFHHTREQTKQNQTNWLVSHSGARGHIFGAQFGGRATGTSHAGITNRGAYGFLKGHARKGLRTV